MPILSRCFPCLKHPSEEVVKLDLGNTAIGESEFPEVWQHERTLEDLSLASTRISALPPQLFYCQALRILNISNNNLDSIPSAIGTLRHLQQLNLSKNFISNVPENLKNCRNLTLLDLSCNNLQRLPDAVTCLLTLQELFLNETYLEFLPANFGRLVNLRILELRLNSLITLPKSMGRLNNLQRIDIGGNEFTELPDVIGELHKLRELWIDFNQIRRITPNIGKLQDLQHFEANGNLIETIPNDISNWRHVEVLSICTNNLQSLPHTLGMLRALTTLKCESCELLELPNSISQLEHLEELVVSHNRLSKLPASIGMLRKLRFLFADDNDLQCLPDEVCSCVSLSLLSVSRNKLTDLPHDIGHLINLKVMNLVDNFIVTLPVSVLGLVNLTSLWINDNQTQPLVPMQYADGAAKTRLTCFMLPQNSVAGVSNIFNGTNNIATNRPTGSSPARRICFAEETNDPNEEIHSEMSKNYAKDATVSLMNAVVDDQSQEYGPRLMRSPTPYPKELRLMAKYMRSGQKVPHKSPQLRDVKEARVVLNSYGNGSEPADQILSVTTTDLGGQDDQQQYFHTNYNDVNEIGLDLGHGHAIGQAGYFDYGAEMTPSQQEILTCQNARGEYVVVQPIVDGYNAFNNANSQVSYLPLDYESGASAGVGVGVGAGTQFSVPNVYTYAAGSYYATPPPPQLLNASDIYEQANATQNQAVLQQQLQQQQHEQQQQLLNHHQQQQQQQLQAEEDEDDEHQQMLQQLPLHQQQQQQLLLSQQQQQQFLTPPPYHIARNFTKKTPQDLSNYETMRKNQTFQIQHDHLDLLDQHDQNTKNDEGDAEINFNTQNCDQTMNMHMEMHLEMDMEMTMTTPSQSQSQPQSQSPALITTKTTAMIPVSPVTQNNYDNQNNVVLSNDEENVSQKIQSSTEAVESQQRQNVNINTMETARANSKKTTTPWLFGKHKNPTVKQISIKCERNEPGFAIGNSSNEDGIFVVSIGTESNAARLLCVNDKLLEINGHDFTSIRLEEANHILAGAGGLISVMLSRK